MYRTLGGWGRRPGRLGHPLALLGGLVAGNLLSRVVRGWRYRVGRRAVVDLALVREREGPWSEHRTDVMGELIEFIDDGKIF